MAATTGSTALGNCPLAAVRVMKQARSGFGSTSSCSPISVPAPEELSVLGILQARDTAHLHIFYRNVTGMDLLHARHGLLPEQRQARAPRVGDS